MRAIPAERGEVLRKRLAHAVRIVDAHRDAAERREREAHRHPVIVVGVDRRRRESARRRDGERPSPASTVAPSFASSVAIAAMRSVSLTRQLPMPVSVVGPSANSATTASVIAASGIAMQSMHDARERTPGAAPRSSRRRCDVRAHPRQRIGERDVALDRVARPTPVTRTGPPPIAPAARKYDADDASPSTRSRRDSCTGRRRHAERPPAVLPTVTPKRRIRFVVIAT